MFLCHYLTCLLPFSLCKYHRQSENSRQRRRERERTRYHSLSSDAAKDRNARRAKLERERYQRLSPEELEAKVRGDDCLQHS